MDMTEDDKRAAAKRRAAERDAEMLAGSAPSALPPDASLPPDAQAMRAAGLTPMERLNLHAAGMDPYDGDMSRMAADKALMPYIHRMPAARTELTIDETTQGKHAAHGLLAELRAGRMTTAELADMQEAYGSKVH